MASSTIVQTVNRFTTTNLDPATIRVADQPALPMFPVNNAENPFYTSVVGGSGSSVIVSTDAGNLITAGTDGGALLTSALFPLTSVTTPGSVTVTALNTLSALPAVPADLTAVVMYVNGMAHGVGSDFTVVGTTITWNSVSAGYDILPGDVITVMY